MRTKKFPDIERSRLDISKGRLERALDAAQKLTDRIAKLSIQREEISAKRQSLEERPEFATNGKLVSTANACGDQCGALDGEINRLQEQLSDVQSGTAPIIADVCAAYSATLEPRITKLEGLICECLEPFYRSPSTAQNIASRSDAVSYLRSTLHLTVMEGRTDPGAIFWLLQRAEHLLSSPDALPWPQLPHIPPAVPDEAMEARAA